MSPVAAPSPPARYTTTARNVHPGDVVRYGENDYTVMPPTQAGLVRLRPHVRARERGPQDVQVGPEATMSVGRRERPSAVDAALIPKSVMAPRSAPPPRKKYRKRVKVVADVANEIAVLRTPVVPCDF